MKVIATNRKASFDYFLEETFEAGIVLQGCEVKSLRNKEASLVDTFVFIRNGEVFLKNLYIKPYDKTTSYQPNERQDRKLLLHKREILKLQRGINEKGYSVVPTKMYFKNSIVKVEIALAKGKKLYDKRETIKNRDIEIEVQRDLKYYK